MSGAGAVTTVQTAASVSHSRSSKESQARKKPESGSSIAEEVSRSIDYCSRNIMFWEGHFEDSQFLKEKKLVWNRVQDGENVLLLTGLQHDRTCDLKCLDPAGGVFYENEERCRGSK